MSEEVSLEKIAENQVPSGFTSYDAFELESVDDEDGDFRNLTQHFSSSLPNHRSVTTQTLGYNRNIREVAHTLPELTSDIVYPEEFSYNDNTGTGTRTVGTQLYEASKELTDSTSSYDDAEEYTANTERHSRNLEIATTALTALIQNIDMSNVMQTGGEFEPEPVEPPPQPEGHNMPPEDPEDPENSDEDSAEESESDEENQGSTAPTNRKSTRAPRLGDPTRFGGQPEKLDQFLRQLEQHFFFYKESFPTGEHKIRFASTYLDGSIFNTYNAYQDTYDQAEDKTKVADLRLILRKYSYFVKFLRSTCGYKDKKEEALRKIQDLKQTGSARDYFQKFEQYSPLTDYNEEQLFHHAKEGLKSYLQDETLRLKTIKGELSYQQMKELIVKLDDQKFMSSHSSNKSNNFKKRTPYKGQHKSNNYQPNRNFQNRPKNNWKEQNGKYVPKKTYGPAPMDLNTTQHNNARQKSNRPPKSTSPECYNCGKTGHIARFCQSAKKAVQWQDQKGKKPHEQHKNINMLQAASSSETSSSDIGMMTPEEPEPEEKEVCDETNEYCQQSIDPEDIPLKKEDFAPAPAVPNELEYQWIWKNQVREHVSYHRSSDERL